METIVCCLVIIASFSDVTIPAGASNYSDDVGRTRDSARHNLLALDNGQCRTLTVSSNGIYRPASGIFRRIFGRPNILWRICG